MSRGEYRSIHTVLVEDTDFQALDPESKLLWYTLKMQLGPSGLGTITAWHAVLEAQTGLTPDRLQSAMKELVEEGWLRVQDNIFWIVNGLRYDPSITLSNDNHASSVQDHLRGLPKREIVNAFAEDHEELEKPWPEIGTEHPSTTPSVPHAGPMGDQGIRNTEDGRPKTEGSGSSLPSVETSPPGEPGESDTPETEPESEGEPYPTFRDELRAWVEDTPHPNSRERFASQHFAVGIYALWQGEDPPEKRPGPNYDMGAELRKLNQRHGAATNRELALFVAGVCLRRDEGEYGGVDPGEGMTLGFVDALNSERNGRSEWSLSKSRGQKLMRDEASSAVDELLKGVGV